MSTSQETPSDQVPFAFKAALGALATLGVIATGVLSGPSGVLLALAAIVLTGAILLFWTSLRTLLGEVPLTSEDAFAIGAPRTEEEQKAATIRALQDLKFEREMGKISEEDYKVLAAKYSAEAKRLLRLIDESSKAHRSRAEQLIEERLQKEGLLETASPVTAEERLASPGGECAACQTSNDIDAVFCKKCGTRLLVNDSGAES